MTMHLPPLTAFKVGEVEVEVQEEEHTARPDMEAEEGHVGPLRMLDLRQA